MNAHANLLQIHSLFFWVDESHFFYYHVISYGQAGGSICISLASAQLSWLNSYLDAALLEYKKLT